MNLYNIWRKSKIPKDIEPLDIKSSSKEDLIQRINLLSSLLADNILDQVDIIPQEDRVQFYYGVESILPLEIRQELKDLLKIRD